MLTRVCLRLALLAAMPAWPQVSSNVSDISMQTPPPVSGESYPVKIASEVRSNYLHAGIIVSTAYNDNVLSGNGTNPVSDISYSIRPTIALDQTTPRLHQMLTYSPGFTFYQRTTALNEQDQGLAWEFQYRLSPHVTASLREDFRKSSNVFNQSYLISGVPISGSAQSPQAAAVAPFASQLNNVANAELTYQFSANDMIGVSGNFTNLQYPDPKEVPGLSNSNSRSGLGFYSRRLSKTQYLGGIYQYSQFMSSPLNETPTVGESDTETNAALLFYTIYLKPNLSFSLSAGPQHYVVFQPPSPATRAWEPAATASIGWQGRRVGSAASYSRIVSGGGSLVGAYYTNAASASLRWQLARTWTVGPTGSYLMTKNVNSSLATANPGGHTVSGAVSMQHAISGHFTLEFGYARIHQSYNNIAVISSAPDANHEFVSISYQLTRPLGR